MFGIKKMILLFIIVMSVAVFVGCDSDSDVDPTPTATPTATGTPTATPEPTDTPEPTATPAEGVNVALLKEIEVSSFTNNDRRGWYPEAVNDGIVEAMDGVHMGWTS